MYSPSFLPGIVLKARQTPIIPNSPPSPSVFNGSPSSTTSATTGFPLSSDSANAPLSFTSTTTTGGAPLSSQTAPGFTLSNSTFSFPSSSSSSLSISLSTAQSVTVSTTFVTSTSSSSAPTSTSSSTSAFSSSVSSSSSSSLTTSSQLQSTSSSSFFDPTPATTLIVSAEISAASTSAVDESSSTSLPVEAATSSKGFWSNKSAVAGTFTAVTVAVLALAAGLFLFVRKKRRSYRYGDELYSDKYPEPEPLNASRPPSSDPGESDFSHAPMDVYAPREPEYYPHPDPFFRSTPVYPAGGSLPEITYSYAKDVNNQYPYYGDEDHVAAPPKATNSTPNLIVQNPFEPQASSNPFEGPSAAGRAGAPPVTYREPAARDSVYQSSIDSFYGHPPSPSNLNAGQAL